MKFRNTLTYIVYYILQFTWGFIQNFLGLIVFLTKIKCPHGFFHGAIVTYWPNTTNCMGLGMFIFMGEFEGHKRPYDDPKMYELERSFLSHEYGHTIQSMLLGPFFFLVVGIPSVCWLNLPYFKKMRAKKNLSYYVAYQEKWANYIGKKVTKTLGPQ